MKSSLASNLHKKWVVLFVLINAWSANGYAQRSTGLFFDDESYSKVKSISPAQSFTGTEETAVSLRSFCPKAGNQGNILSCVGWAVAYGAYTTAVSKVYNITDKTVITNQAYSAPFLFNQIKTPNCGGASLNTAFDFMKNNGVCKAVEFNPSDCLEKPDEKIVSLAKRNRIKSYLTLFPLGAHSDLKVAATIKELHHGRPVVVGMNITKSFYELGKDGLWTPQPDEVYTGGHAMCVVGYDNLIKQFEILNSWGPDFGDNGYLYMSYKDFAKHCKYAYTFILDESQPNDAFTFKGSYYLNKLVGKNRETNEYLYDRIEGARSGEYYSLNKEALNLNSYFKVMASEMADGNALYIFSIKPDGTGELLFPTKRQNSNGVSLSDNPIILDEDSYIELPPNFPLKADQAGDDSLIFLYSKTELDDPDGLVAQIAGEKGDLMTRLSAVLGDKLVPASAIKYEESSMQFSGSSNKGTIVPLVLKVKINP
jgi:hypothetical protein